MSSTPTIAQRVLCAATSGILSLALLGLGPAPTRAATIFVAPGAVIVAPGDGECSLREAIRNANDDGVDHSGGDCALGDGADTIVLAADATYLLNEVDNVLEGPNGLPPLTSAITIEGNDATIAADINDCYCRVLFVAAEGTATLRDVTLKWGGDLEGIQRGGGLYNDGATTLEGCTVSHNYSGGVHNVGALTLTNTVVTQNDSRGTGGVHNVGYMEASGSAFTWNDAQSGAGGLYNAGGAEMYLSDSQVIGNWADASAGGGILTDGTLELSRCTVIGNRVWDHVGGGIYSAGSTRIVNSIIRGNSAFGFPGGGGGGGGIAGSGYVLDGTTVTGNSIGRGRAGGVAGATVRNSIIIGNMDNPVDGPPAPDCVDVTSLGYNLFGEDTGCPTGNPTDRFVDPALLATVLTAGGDALPAGSPAIDAGSCTDSNGQPIAVDLHGDPRPFDDPFIPNADGGCDMGAVERQAVSPPANQPPVADAGEDQTVVVGGVVLLDGGASFDPDGDPLTYAWALTTPTGSDAALSDPATVSPTFCADVAGTYTATLVVNDGLLDSDPDAVTVTAIPPEAALGALADSVAALGPPPAGDGTLNRGLVRALTNKLDQAQRALDRGRPDLAGTHLSAFSSQVVGLQKGGRLTATQAAVLTEAARVIVGALTAPCTTGRASAAVTQGGRSRPTAYPNPFADRTTIAYDVSDAAGVRLAVYDVLGREVALLTDGYAEAGTHVVTFDARGLAAGTYVWRLTIGRDLWTGQLTLMR